MVALNRPLFLLFVTGTDVLWEQKAMAIMSRIVFTLAGIEERQKRYCNLFSAVSLTKTKKNEGIATKIAFFCFSLSQKMVSVSFYEIC